MKSKEAPQLRAIAIERKYLWFEELQEQGLSDVSKLMRLLARINPLYMVNYFFQKPALPVKSAILKVLVAVLSFGLITTPLFAGDYTLPPSESPLQAPTITVEQALTQSSATTSPSPVISSAESFLSGPLTAATSEALIAEKPALYVSATGSDTADGSEASPWKTIQYAVSQLKAGDTLNILAGTYQQPGGGAALKASGTSDAYITIQGVGEVIIQGTGTTTISGYTVASNFSPAFDTKGYDYIRFNNLTVNNLRDGVEVSPGSSYIEIDDLRANNNHFAVKINGGDHVTVRNVVAVDNRNGFRTENTMGVVPTDILFENIEVRGSKDVYSGFESKYRNGDGFILEAGNRITLRDVVSHDNWDAGFDIKAVNVLMENVITYGNKNNFKIWGNGIVVKNALSYGAKIRVDDPVAGEGYGVNARMGQVTFINSTFVDNENVDIRVDNDGGPANVTFQNSIIGRKLSSGAVFVNEGGTFTDKNNVWYWQGHSDLGINLSNTSIGADPKFVNWSGKDFRLQSSSPAINFGSSAFPTTTVDIDGNVRIVDGNIDAGAFEYQGVSAPDTTVPVISAVASTSVTSTGATINWTTNESSDSQVQYRVKDSTAWLTSAINASLVSNHSVALSGLIANTDYEYQVKSKDSTGNLAVQTGISTFKTLDSTTTPPPTTSCTTAMCGVTSNQEVSGIIKVQPNLTLNPDIKKVAYYLNGSLSTREYTSPFIWGGTGFDTRALADGIYTLGGAYTTSTGDKNFSFTIQVKNSVVIPDTIIPVISAVTSTSVTSTGATINWTTNEPSDSQVEYRIQGSTTWLTSSINTLMVTSHSALLSGLNVNMDYEYRVRSKDQSGNLAVQTNISTFKTLASTTTPPPATSCVTAICGVASNQEVSGIIKVQPNLTLNPDVRKVSYYLNGTQSGKEYSAPFTWGGTGGFDTTKLANGTYTLGGAYTTATGDKTFSITFTVNNNSVPVPTPVPDPTASCTTAICGIQSNQTVTGTLKVQPNLTLNPGIKKVAYYLNGTLFERSYAAPFTWGGATGIDTRILTNGTHTLSGAYTTAAGDVPFSFTFVVQN